MLTLIIVVIIIGALLGGRSLGGIIRNGCGFIAVIILILIALLVFAVFSLHIFSRP